MSDSPQSPAPEPWNLESCLDALQKDLSLDHRVYDATERALEQIARMYYPSMANWDPKLLGIFTERIRSAAHAHSLTLANLHFASNHLRKDEEGA